MIPKDYFDEDLLTHIANPTQCNLDTTYKQPSIWEREAFDSFLEVDAQSDWLFIENRWSTIVPSIPPNEDLFQAVRCLHANFLGQKALAIALDKSETILPIAIAANAMKPSQIAVVATHSTSNRTRFTLVESLAFNQPLETDTTEKLTSILHSIQNDQSEWKKWMKAFNRYPVRTRALQPAFGASLVNSSEDAKLAYINAIELRASHGDCHEAISIGLRAFHEVAGQPERRVL